ncbi:nitrate reductase [Methylomonas albis]|uniref:Molybdopterin-dependent oxidoreductase n=1 Tax=Methylomonas albis TaxID=1854563 RepID=A0ABR9D0F0_9GAMM|nr:nitrate reductase [Methylomonas albis]MBD9356475.1 molybdopterin-dependent oxidoreductase [Methylomonas albis]
MNTIKTTCPYCGVGCGIEATVEDSTTHRVTIKGDSTHPANFGKLCSKGATLGDTVSLENRLLYPSIHGQRVDWDSALNHVAARFNEIIEKHGPEAVAFYVSGQLLTEDYYVANKLMKGFIGTANIDTNSRLCMSSAVVGYKRAFGADTVPCNYEDLELAELILLVGSNAAWCHPIAFQRIRKAKENNPNLKVVVIDPRATASCDIADLHLPVKPGMDALLFNGILAHLQQNGRLDQAYIDDHTEGFAAAVSEAQHSAGSIEQVASACGLSSAAVGTLFDWFAHTEKTVTVYSQGINQSGSGSDKCNAIINCHLATGRIGKPGMGPFSFTGQPNAMGGREVGGLANTLAAHMDLDNPEHVDRVSRFWGSDKIADKQGLKAVAMFDAIAAGQIKAVWIMATNPVVSMPDADKVKHALQQCELVVVSDCIANTDTAQLAHVLLPATGWSEKDGTVTNLERRISRQRPLFPASGAARHDWWIISQVAQRMGFREAFNYASSADVFREHAALSAFENDTEHQLRDFNLSAFARIDQHDFDALQPVQWPVSAGHTAGTARMFADGQYFTANRKARFISITPRPPVNAPNADYPFTLNTGRLRDQWHTMTRTGLAAKLTAHRPEPFVEIHPTDAERLGLAARSLANIQSLWGNMLARVEINPGQQIGSLFVPMHWTGQTSSHGRMGAVVNPVVDPHSGQPESKQTPVHISTWPAQWYATILSRKPLHIEGAEYQVKVRGERYFRYELASTETGKDWRVWARSLLAAEEQHIDDNYWLEYSDQQAGYYRTAYLLDRELQACLFVGPNSELPEPGWLGSLFAKTELSRAERLSLLSGLPPKGETDIGRIVCSCFNVGEKSIKQAVQTQQLQSVADISACLNAGSGCGSCVAELKEFLPKPT